MTWNEPGGPGRTLPPPPPAPAAEWTWPPTPRPATGAGRPAAAARITVRGAVVMVLGFATAMAVLVRTFVDVGRVPAIIGTGAPVASGSGRFLLVAVALVVAAVLSLLHEDAAGLVGGLAAASIGLLGTWVQAGRTGFTAPTFVGAVAVGVAGLAFAVGAVWSTATPPLPTSLRATGALLSGLVLVGGLLPLRGGTFNDLTLPVLLMVAFAAGHRHGLFGAIGLVVARLEFPAYYAAVSPQRNPFRDVLHPVTFVALVLVLLTAIVGLASTGSASNAAGPNG